MKNVLLYGAGTQSTGLLLMLLDGKFGSEEKPDLVIFADTHAEPGFVIDYFWKVTKYVLNRYGLLITSTFKSTGGGLETDLMHGIGRVASLPLFTANGGVIRRQCTDEYKIQPINKCIKAEFKIPRKPKNFKPMVNIMFGISLDEIERTRISTNWWAVNSYPLVNERMYRHEVIDYINNNHPELKNPPRSSCYFCPFHSDNYWKKLKEKHPEEFNKAIEIDEKIRVNPKLDNECFLHRSLKPLKDVDFYQDTQMDIFGECEGYCGI